MKRKFIMIPVLIQGPRQPGNDIDVYLRPLVEELLLLWNRPGVRVWDEHKQEHFDLRALLFVTINDWPALSNLLGQSNKGYNACTHCFDDIKGIFLKVVFGKAHGSEPVLNDADGHAPMWKKKYIFWELPYWQVLEVRSTIDVMHLTKNLCVNLLGFMGVYGKAKDILEAR